MRVTRISRLAAAALALALVGSVLVGTGAALADSATASVAVSGGALSYSLTNAGGTITVTPVTLTGDDQSTAYTLTTSVTDARGASSGGWNLTISGSAFSTGGGSPVALGETSSFGTITVVRAGSTTQTSVPTNGITPPSSIPTSSTKFFSAASGQSSMGKFTLTIPINVSIPANAYAGTFTSTVVVTAAAGP